jgi:hypothetical protein
MNAEVKPTKHSAAGQYLGYALQPVRLFYHLLTCPKGARVSLEYLDDVAVHYSDGSLYLEQTKSAQKQNPVSDWAIDLWKAFDNWVAMVDDGVCVAGASRFSIYVTPPKTGAFVTSLAEASTVKQLADAIQTVGQKLDKLKTPPGCAAHLKRFLEATEATQQAIGVPFALIADSNDPLDAIRTLLQPSIADEHIDLLIKSGIGQAKQAVDRLIQRGGLAILDADAFRRDFHAFVRLNNLPGLLLSTSEIPDDSVVSAIASTRPVFIRQLELVEVEAEDRIRAISHFMRTSADKADWAERGYIFPGSLEHWDGDLVARHSLIRGDVSDLHSDKAPVVQGRLAYRQAMRHQAPLEGRVVPEHFVQGSFHDLADRRRLGWHPDYNALLDGGE